MTRGRGIIDQASMKAETATIAIAAALLNDTQMQILANSMAGNTAEENYAILAATQPADVMKSGPILPYLVGGKLKDFPLRIHDAVSTLLCLIARSNVSGGGKDAAEVFRMVFEGVHTLLQQGTKPMVGSRAYYEPGSQAFSAEEMRSVGDSFTPAALWLALNLSPSSLGDGFTGTAELKGTLANPSFQAAGVSRAAGNSPHAHDDLSAAQQHAGKMEEVD